MISREKKKGMQVGKEEIKTVSLHKQHNCVYIKYQGIHTHTLELVNMFRKIIGHKVNTAIKFPCISNG